MQAKPLRRLRRAVPWLALLAVLAGLAAEGETTITALHHLERGYESIEDSLAAVGAQIRRVEE